MTSLDSRFKSFQEKYDLPEEALSDMLNIFNDSFIQLAHKLLNEENNAVKNNSEKQIKKQLVNNKKFATKIACEFAEENSISIDNFDKEKVTKKDIEEFIKNRKTKNKTNATTIKSPSINLLNDKKQSVKVTCCGLDKSGKACNREATANPEGAKKSYCFRHAMEWKNFELSSDSDEDEESNCDKDGPTKINIIEKNSDSDSDN